MATWTIAGIALGPNGPVNGATVYVWKAQRFPTPPAQNGAAPPGSADAGPVTSGTAYGSVGSYNIGCPTDESYYVAVTYAGVTYWTLVNDLNYTDEVQTTVAAASNGVNPSFTTNANMVSTLAASITSLTVVTATGCPQAGTITVVTSLGVATYTVTAAAGTTLTVTFVSQTGGAGSVTNGAVALTQITTLAVASTTGFNASGRINGTVTGQVVLAYASVTGGGSPSFNNVTVVSGSTTGTLATGGAITSTQQISTINQIIDDGLGDATDAGNRTVSGNLTVTGTTTLTGAVAAITVTGTTTLNGKLVGHVTTKNTSALPYTTLSTDLEVILTGSTAAQTLTMGTTSFTAGQMQTVLNESTVAVTLAAATGAVIPISLPPQSGVFMEFDGTNWNAVGSYGTNPDSSQRVIFTTPTPSTGAAFTVSTASDAMLYIKCTTSTTLVVTMGPSTGAENSLVTSVTVPIGAEYSILVPRAWKVVVTATIADFTFRAQTI